MVISKNFKLIDLYSLFLKKFEVKEREFSRGYVTEELPFYFWN
jgi:hypothetical protein